VCEGNLAVQAQISELEVQKVPDSPQMRAKGITDSQSDEAELAALRPLSMREVAQRLAAAGLGMAHQEEEEEGGGLPRNKGAAAATAEHSSDGASSSWDELKPQQSDTASGTVRQQVSASSSSVLSKTSSGGGGGKSKARSASPLEALSPEMPSSKKRRTLMSPARAAAC
jgi:hypothetical protein